MSRVMAILLCIAFLLAAEAAHAEIVSIVITVDGLSCPFCAYGVEKKLKRVGGVEALDILMNEGTVTLTSAEGLSIDFKEVPGAIRDSGFSLRKMYAEATGTVIEDNGDLFLKYAGPGERLVLKGMGQAMRRKLIGYIGSAETVVVKGALDGKPGGQWALKPENAEAAGK